MSREVFVHLLPELFEPDAVRGGCVVVLDILRASTTIVHALAHGAANVVPTLTVDEALSLAATRPVGSFITGGEREGLLIPGFDLDNNPFAYTPHVVAGKSVIFTTTNGTKALLRSKAADRVLIGSFVNLAEVVRVLATDARPVHLVCAGTRGKISSEDVLCAGAIVERLATVLGAQDDEWFDDQLQVARALYRQSQRPGSSILAVMRQSYGGRNCRRLGFDDQIARAATCDIFDFVPEYHGATGEIRA